MKDQNKKKILSLRWAVIIVTSYLILFGKGKVTDINLGHLLILVYILSNFLLIFVPPKWFSNLKFFYSLILIDTGIVSFGMFVSEKVTTDFYLVFFLILIFASMSRNYKLLMIISGVAASLYGILLYSWGLLNSEHAISYAIRIPFIFIMAAFYGYIVQTFSEEKQRQLTFSEDKYRGLFENASVGIIILSNLPWQIADLNSEVERLIGYEKEELLRKDALDLFALADKEKALIFFEEVIKEGEGRTDALSLIRKDGKPCDVDLSIKRIDLENGSFFQVIFRDLTEQRRLEKKIRESKRNLEAIFDGIRDRLSIQSPDYEILRVNRAVIEKYKSTYRELIGKKCYETYYQRSQPCEECPVKVTIQTQQVTSSIMKIPEADTTLRILSYPILDEKGNLFSIIEHVQDVTEEQRLQEQLIQSEKLAGIGILASGVAHEINNPLGGIIGMAEASLEEEDISTIRSYLTDILNCGQRISEIVKGLKSYCRIAKQEEQNLIDMNDVLEESLKMVRLAVKTSPVEVIKKFQPIDKVVANLGEIQQVFTNLIANAFQAMDVKGGILTLATRSFNDSVEVKVSDKGMGIPQKYLNKIFDPFFTTKKTGEGTGLGLNIVYRIVTKYGGTIDVESKELLLHFGFQSEG
jgi:PAS domain S-box-containing protein